MLIFGLKNFTPCTRVISDFKDVMFNRGSFLGYVDEVSQFERGTENQA